MEIVLGKLDRAFVKDNQVGTIYAQLIEVVETGKLEVRTSQLHGIIGTRQNEPVESKPLPAWLE